MALLGLYYPYIHFRSDAWLKSSALYWDQMGRIVPGQYGVRETNMLHDSTIVKELADAGYVQDIDPYPAANEVSSAFLNLLDEHGRRLAKRFGVSLGVDQPNPWETTSVTGLEFTDVGDETNVNLAYVFSEKIRSDLVHKLQQLGLAQIGRGPDGDWIGMNPRLADIYMLAMASALAPRQGAQPVADAVGNHMAAAGFEMDRLASVLLGDDRLRGPKRRQSVAEKTMMSIALEYVTPVGIEEVPLDRILKFRQEFAGERAAYQDQLQRLVAECAPVVADVDNAAVLQNHFNLEYDKRIAPQLGELRNAMSKSKIKTISSILNVQFSMPPLAVSTAAALGLTPAAPVVLPIGAGTAAFAIWNSFARARRDRQAAVDASPVGYLYRIEHDLMPGTVALEVGREGTRFGAA